MERLDSARGRRAEYEAELTSLRDGHPVASGRDQMAAELALTLEEDGPAREAPAIENEIERLEREAVAIDKTIGNEIVRIKNLVERSRNDWSTYLECRLTNGTP